MDRKNACYRGHPWHSCTDLHRLRCGGEPGDLYPHPEEIKQQFIDSCQTYSYEEIARNPTSYLAKHAKFKGEVIQVMPEGDSYTLRVNITQGSYFWSDPILVTYTKQDSNEANILEDDIVMMYGLLMGDYTYETVMGNELTVPFFMAEYIDIQ